LIFKLIENIKESQKNVNKNSNYLKNETKILLSNRFVKNGKNLKTKFGKIGVYVIPGTIVGEGHGNSYPIRIDINYENLKKGEIYYIDYKLIKEINENVYNNFIIKNEEDSKKDNILSTNISLTNINVEGYLEEKNSEDNENLNSSI